MSMCNHCGYEGEMKREQKGPHLGVYCPACGGWIKWEKQENKPKKFTSDEPATQPQINFIKMAASKGIRKDAAQEIISILKAGGMLEGKV